MSFNPAAPSERPIGDGSPLLKPGLISRVAPFATVAFAGVAAIFIGTDIQRPGLALLALAITCLILISVLAIDWARIPRHLHALPALAYYPVIAILRHAAGGSDSGFAPLVFVPLIWLALYGTRREMLSAVGSIVLVFSVPQFLGFEQYSATEWRRAVLFVAVGFTAGSVIQTLIGRLRSSEAKALSQARELSRAQAEFEAVFDHSPIGMATCDLEGHFISVNSAFSSIMGRSKRELEGLDFRVVVHPDDLATAESAFDELLSTGGRAYRGERRYVQPDGTVVYTILNGTVVHTPEGAPSHLFIQTQDITATKEHERALERTSTTMSSLAAATRAITSGEDPRNSICEAALAVSGGHMTALLEPDGDYFDLTASAGFELPPIRIDRMGEPSGTGVAFTSKRRYFVEDAENSIAVSQRLVEATGARSVLFEPIIDGAGGAIGVLVVAWTERGAVAADTIDAIGLLAFDAAAAIERSDLLERLECLARTDPLTGLPNRRVVDEEIDREIARSQRLGHPVCLAMIDLDHFKTYNDSYGHQAGDVALKEAASGWASQLRATDVLGRFGGEEFVVILPYSDAEESVDVIERLREVAPGGLTFSAGIAQWDGSESRDDLLRRADAGLYEAKDAGRDRIVVVSARV